MQKPAVLLILDGWGLAPPGPGNAISMAKLKHIPALWTSYPHGQLIASGEPVGLPDGEAGNTETGHINIGAGRTVLQDFLRINRAIEDGSFFQNVAFLGALRHAQTNTSNIHILGLISDAGVHSSRNHLYALLELFKQKQSDRPVFLHLFTDGRDSQPTDSLGFITQIQEQCAKIGVGTVATLMGRYYGMDRDRRWERTEKAYMALTEQIDHTAGSASEAIRRSYREGITDEFIEPVILLDKGGKPYPRIANKDAVIFFNFRIDRPRQLTRAFVLPTFERRMEALATNIHEDTRNMPFRRKTVLDELYFVSMTQYEKSLPCIAAFPPQSVPMPLGQVYAERGLAQLRVAETEKERFVTYYFNGMHEGSFAAEERLIVASPKVATYDLTPKMSTMELTDALLEKLKTGTYALLVVNYAGPDLLGHTGNIKAAVTACETVDACVGRVVEAVLALNGTCIITADHGNVEEMLDSDGKVNTEHSLFPVPFIMIHSSLSSYPYELPQGKLGDIAPTLLCFAGFPVPPEMTGINLLTNVPI